MKPRRGTKGNPFKLGERVKHIATGDDGVVVDVNIERDVWYRVKFPEFRTSQVMTCRNLDAVEEQKP